MKQSKPAKFVTLLAIALALTLAGCSGLNRGKPIAVESYTETIRVACIGDSITFGSGIKDRSVDSYPAQLQDMLGLEWQVRNFGVSGATLLKNGDLPYWDQKPFKDAQAYKPHVVVIKLGTNDTKPQNWKYADQFVSDYVDMIQAFAELPSEPRIWICYPVPAFEVRWGIREEIITSELIPLITRVSRQTHTPVINLYKALDGRSELFPDAIHPDPEGAGLIAAKVYSTLTGNKPPKDKQAGLPKVLLIGDSISIGYNPPTKELLAGKARVYHNRGNAAHTANGVKLLDTWLGKTKWDVIHFNFGLHDLKHLDASGKPVDPPAGAWQIPIDRYAVNLELITERLRKTGAKLIFATTTPVPKGAAMRLPGDEVKYNNVAKEIMKRHGVPINDLYTYALPRLAEIQRPRNVHFTPEGSKLLAGQVTEHILEALGVLQ